jgi:hypothetical protein
MFRMLRLKPPHGWNAVAWELGIVTLGVLVALGVQQMAEAANWRSKVRDGQLRLRSEMLVNGAYMAEQIMIEPCIKAQVETLSARLTASSGTLDPAPLIPTGMGFTTLRFPTRPWTAQTWEALQQDGTSNHMSGDVQAKLGLLFEKVRQLRDITVKSDDGLGTLRLLGQPIALSPDLKADLQAALWAQLLRSETSSLNASQTLMLYRQIDFAPSFDEIEARQEVLTPGRSGDLRTLDYCRREGLPIADWRADVEKAR